MKTVKKKDRHDKIMDARVKLAARFDQGWIKTGLGEAIDYLFYELDLLIYEVEELKKIRPARRRK